MIIINLRGQMGNQLFQWALFRSLQMNGKHVKIDTSFLKAKNLKEPLKEIFHLKYDVIKSDREKWNVIYHPFEFLPIRINKRFYHKKALNNHYIPSILTNDYNPSIFNKNWAYLDGYFQSERYFQGPEVQEQLRLDLRCPDYVQQSSKYQKWLKRIKDSPSCSIHFRRTDYLEMDELYGNICTETYYENAIKEILETNKNSHFFIFSDDKEYVQNYFKEKYSHLCYTVVNDDLEDIEDFFLMSSCTNHILAHSSFSWWAAWLDDNPASIILAPEKWNNLNNWDAIYTSRMKKIKIQ